MSDNFAAPFLDKPLAIETRRLLLERRISKSEEFSNDGSDQAAMSQRRNSFDIKDLTASFGFTFGNRRRTVSCSSNSSIEENPQQKFVTQKKGQNQKKCDFLFSHCM